jgi:hypothetical protein
LLKLLAVDFKNFMTIVEEYDNGEVLKDPLVVEQLTEVFKTLKKQIINYYTCTKKYRE